MTPYCTLMSEILKRVAAALLDYEEGENATAIKGPFDTQQKIDAAIESLEDRGLEDYFYDAKSELRSSYSHETGIPCERSRHYESMSVAKQVGDKWVGWTYWYGGGKHGEPNSIDWIEDAYFLDAKEETKVVLTFTKQPEPAAKTAEEG